MHGKALSFYERNIQEVFLSSALRFSGLFASLMSVWRTVFHCVCLCLIKMIKTGRKTDRRTRGIAYHNKAVPQKLFVLLFNLCCFQVWDSSSDEWNVFFWDKGTFFGTPNIDKK